MKKHVGSTFQFTHPDNVFIDNISLTYPLGKTRVVVNPYGYKDVEVNPQYDKQLLIEL